MSIRIVAISDTHGRHGQFTIPDGDILIHGGDMTSGGALAELESFNDFLEQLPHPRKIVIAGNHDYCLERQPEAARERLDNAIYLQDESITIGELTLYGSPWQPWFLNLAFNLRRGPEIRQKWDLIPDGVDILITHGPPFGLGDRTTAGEQVGCEDLLAAVQRVRPRLHLYGHIHEGHGVRHDGGVIFANASLCDHYLRPAYQPLVFDYEGGELVLVE